MNVGVASSESNPNHSYLNHKGAWVTYLIITALIHIVLLSIPGISTPWAWTLTNVLHNMITLSVLHFTFGTPWETADQAAERNDPLWDQIDRGAVFTGTKKFLTMVPIILFFLASFYTSYERVHFIVNVIFLTLALVPKLPVRIPGTPVVESLLSGRKQTCHLKPT